MKYPRGDSLSVLPGAGQLQIFPELADNFHKSGNTFHVHPLFEDAVALESGANNGSIGGGELALDGVDTAAGVAQNHHIGICLLDAGDQGIVYGYATDETPELMPLPFMVATHALEILRRIDFPYLRPDAKAQVTFDYEKRRIDTFLISCQHREDVPMEALRIIIGCAMIAAAAHYGLNRDFKMLINPTGSFVVGGSFADTGVTGRKIIADSYGGVCRHGGGAFSGKDPTKIDRSGAYMARKIARDIVAADNAHRCEVQIAYAIGVAEPVAVSVNTFGTGKFSDDVLADLVKAKYDLTPRGIIEQLHLKDVDYNAVSAYGHFGKGHLPWEQ